MKFEYVSRLLLDIISDPDQIHWTDLPEVGDYRGVIEVRFKEEMLNLKAFLHVVEEVCHHGWVASDYTDSARHLFGVSFDLVGDDFEGLRVVMPEEGLRQWTYRYVNGKDRSVVPELAQAVEAILTGKDIIAHTKEAASREKTA